MVTTLLSTETIAALIGAIVGGAGSALVQQLALRRADKAHDLGAAYELLLAAQECFDSSRKFSERIVEARASAAQLAPNAELWRGLLPLANYPGPVLVRPEAFALLLRRKEAATFNALRNAVALHNQITDVWRAYGNARRELASRMPAQMQGFVGTTTLDAESAATVGPLIAELVSIADALATFCEEPRPHAETGLSGVLKVVGELSGSTMLMEGVGAVPQTDSTATISKWHQKLSVWFRQRLRLN